MANVAAKQWHDVGASQRLITAIALATEETLIRADAQLLTRASAIADAEGLSVYDAAYVAAQEQTGWRLISLDSDLTTPGFALTPAQLLAD